MMEKKRTTGVKRLLKHSGFQTECCQPSESHLMPCTLRLEPSEGGRTQLVAEEKREERQGKEIEREMGRVGNIRADWEEA